MNRLSPGALVVYGKALHVVVAVIDKTHASIVPVRKYSTQQHRADLAVLPDDFPLKLSVGRFPRIACGYPVTHATAILGDPIGNIAATVLQPILQATARELARKDDEDRYQPVKDHRIAGKSNVCHERA